MVTIESKNHSINLGGGGFICLRTKVCSDDGLVYQIRQSTTSIGYDIT